MDWLKLVQGRGHAEAGEPGGEIAGGPGARHVKGSEFKKLVAESEVPVVVDFWAEWCGPCHMLAPSVDQLAREYVDKAVVAKVDADENPEILQRFGIMGIPTLIYFKGGKEADRVVGVTRYGTLKAKLEKLTA